MNLRLPLFAAALIAAPAVAQTSPAARAAAYDDAIVAVMKQGAAKPARVERFTGIVTTYYDMPAIAAMVAGTAWSSASAGDRQGLITALTRHSAIQLAKNFDKYSGEKFIVDPTVQTRADSSIVKVTIQSSGGKQDILYYRMRGSKIIDVISGGVSQLAVQKSDVASIVSSGGVAAVVKRFQQVDG